MSEFGRALEDTMAVARVVVRNVSEKDLKRVGERQLL